MAMQIPDYTVFAQMPVEARKQSLAMIRRFAGKHATTLFLQVYQFDPDAEIREIARSELAKHGVTPPTEPTPINVPPSSASVSFTSTSPGSFETFASLVEQTPGASIEIDSHTSTIDLNTIDGGSGRPITRGPQHASVFTLFRPYKRFLTGEVDHLPHRPWPYFLVAAILIGVLAILFVSFRSFNMPMAGGFNSDSVLLLIGGIFAFVLVVMFGVWLWNTKRNRRYVRDGTLLLGRVLNAYGRWHTSTDSDGGTSRSYVVTVHYRVRLPDGSTFDSQAKNTRGDLASGVGIPRAGDPVAVLVIDREHMRLL